MEIVKKNLVSILCGVVALLCIIAAFFPMGGFVDELKTTLEDRKQLYDKIKVLNKDRPLMPQVKPDAAEVPKLTVFPSQKVYTWGIAQTKMVHDQADQMEKFAREVNNGPDNSRTPAKHAPLVARNNPNYDVQFLREYDRLLHPIVVNTGRAGEKPDSSQMGQLLKDLKMGIAPSAAEIEEAKSIAHQNFQQDPTAAATDNQKHELDAVNAAVQALIVTRSKSIGMYVLPDERGFYFSPRMKDAVTNAASRNNPVNLWFAQTGIWIQQDLARSIAALNAGATDVTQAAIKRLVQVNIQEAYITETGYLNLKDPSLRTPASGTPAPTGTPPPPTPTTPGGTDKPGNKYAFTPTGRVCNDLYDVMHFTVTIDIDSQRLHAFLTELSKDRQSNSELAKERLITVLNVDHIIVIDQAKALDAGYVYGSAPVVQATIKCEAVFLRKVTESLMPNFILDILPKPDATPKPPAN